MSDGDRSKATEHEYDASPNVASERRYEVTSLGEAMLRLSVGAGRKLATTDSLDLHVAGAELNVCAALAGLGRRVGWFSRLPDNPLGQLILSRARGWGVDTERVVRTAEGRVGTYFIEFSSPPIPARVTYDRADSTFSKMEAGEIDWARLLDTRVLHLTGITPALGSNLQEVTRQAVARARERGLLVSLDVNYRSKLWQPAEAAEFLRPLMGEVDLLICGRNDARLLFGIDTLNEQELLDELRSHTDAPHVVITLGKEGAIAWSEGQVLRQQAIPVTVIDRIGAGDAFAAGVIDGLLEADLEGGLSIGAALAALTLAQHGDVISVGREEVGAVARLAGEPGTGVLR
ncbi:MAG: sugar kinase [Trueperaceae bacterium]